MKLCSVEGCGAAHVAKGYCGGHYVRWKRGATALRKPMGAPVDRRSPAVCTECGEPAYAKGLCVHHRNAAARGDRMRLADVLRIANERRLAALRFLAETIERTGRTPGCLRVARAIGTTYGCANRYVRWCIARGWLAVVTESRCGRGHRRELRLTDEGQARLLQVSGGRGAA